MESRFPFSPEEIERAKMIDPYTLLGFYGLSYQQVGEQLRVRAPWRDETEPSVFIRVNPATGHLIWKDFGGEQDGGSAIDFVMKASKVSFVEAVSLLLELQGEPVLPEHPAERLPSSFSRKSLPKGYTHKVLKVKSKVDHTALTSLLRRKGIDPDKLPPWLKELHWEVEREDGYRGRFFGLAVKTVGGSWIVRTALDKRPKTVVQEDGTSHSFAFFPERKEEKGQYLVVLEGISDALSFWQAVRNGSVRGAFDIVILGGTGTVQDFIESGVWTDYEEIFLALDLDEAGMRARDKIVASLRELGYRGLVSSFSRSLSEVGKDVNEILGKGESLKFDLVYSGDLNRQDLEEEGWSPGL
jgi:5S rRNA maturation endonuclease (ribonuclease M5)